MGGRSDALSDESLKCDMASAEEEAAIAEEEGVAILRISLFRGCCCTATLMLCSLEQVGSVIRFPEIGEN